jgi:hypothetical protein
MSEHQLTTQAAASAMWRLGLATRLRVIRNELSEMRELLLAALAEQRPERQQEHRNGTVREAQELGSQKQASVNHQPPIC